MVNSDYQFVAKPSDAERYISNFKFRGPGWYVTPESTILVVPTDRAIHKWWHQSDQPEEHFVFYFWRGNDRINIASILANAPTRYDYRIDDEN